jgi:putative copper resistance protein D
MIVGNMGTFSWHHLNQWHLGLTPILFLVLAGVLYEVGARRTPHWPRYRHWTWFAGLGVTFGATQSVLGVYDMAYVSAHMVQHLLLLMVAGPLFALSAPLDLLAWCFPGQWTTSRFLQVVLHPLVAFGLYAVFIPATHLTGLFDQMLRHEWFHHGEQIAFLVVGYLFFRVAFGVEGDSRLHPGLRFLYVMVAVPVDTITGLALAMTSHNPFPAFVQTSPMMTDNAWRLNNVHLGGAIMWIGGDALMLLACFPIAFAWVAFENARTKVLDEELDRRGI